MSTVSPGSQASLREANIGRVLHALRTGGSQTQTELARATGLSPATVSTIVRDLRVAGTVDVVPAPSRGRRARRVSLTRSAGLVAGVDLGHSHLRVAVADLAHRVVAEQAVPLAGDLPADKALVRIEELLDECLETAGAARRDVRGVGVGLPGPVDPALGAVRSYSILPGWVGVPAAQTLGARLGLHIRVDNDANLGALAEMTWGAARGHRDLVYVKASTGLGAGIVLGGILQRGSQGTAGELGHTTVDEAGRVCRCGNRGCLETYVGTPFLLELLRDSHGTTLTARDMIQRAQEGDAGCRRVIADAGRHLGGAVATLCNLLNPSVVVVGGDLAAGGETLLGPLRETMRRHTIPSAAEGATIVASALGDRAEMLGAVALVLQEAEVGWDPDS